VCVGEIIDVKSASPEHARGGKEENSPRRA
jgi:hypothetical protein